MSPRGIKKRGAFMFKIWFENGSYVVWTSNRVHSDHEIAEAIRRYLVPVMERHATAHGGEG